MIMLLHSYDRVLIPGYTKQDFINKDLPFSPYHAAKFYVLHSSQIFIQFIGVAAITHLRMRLISIVQIQGKPSILEALKSYTI